MHFVNSCKDGYKVIAYKLLQEELIRKRTFAKKETLNIGNNMQQITRARD